MRGQKIKVIEGLQGIIRVVLMTIGDQEDPLFRSGPTRKEGMLKHL